MRAMIAALALLALFVTPCRAQANGVTPGYIVCNSALGGAQPCGWVAGTGPAFEAVITPTVQNASYSSGNAIGGLITLANVLHQNGNDFVLNNLSVWSKGGSTTAITFYIFKANPTGSTCTDKSAFSLAAADIGKLIPTIPPVLTPAVTGAGTTATSASQQLPVATKNTEFTQNIYICAVVGGTVTPATTADLVFDVSGIQN